MTKKIEELQRDIHRLKTSIEWIEHKLREFDNDPHYDHTLVAKYIKDKTEAENLLEEKRTELRMEEYKEDNKVTYKDQKENQKEFNRKNDSYSITRSSYPKSVDN